MSDGFYSTNEILKRLEAADPRDPRKNGKIIPHPNQKAPAPATLVTRKASSYEMAALDWLWPERFAIGKLGLIGGLPDRGKGLISSDLIACATNNHLLPCNEGRVPQGRVLYFTAEDDPEDTVVPRLVAAGADLDKVEIVEMVREPNTAKPRTFNLTTDLDLLRAKLEELKDVVLVIIDPISAYLGIGKVNSHSTTDVRGFLMPLKDLAKEKSVSMIGIMHFNKKTDVHDAMLRIADSLAYAATARHVYCVLDDPEVENQRLFVKAKNNATGPAAKTLSYMTGARKVGFDEKRNKEIWAPYIIWGQKYVEITAGEAMKAEAGGHKARDQLREAMEFLKEALANGPMKQTDIKREAVGQGISSATLRRAKEKLKIISEKGKGSLDADWTWRLPPAQETGV
jgi:RecA-family ATPase